MAVTDSILSAFGLSVSDFDTEQIGTGHIHQTYKLTGKHRGPSYILQRINTYVFKQPDVIASNLRAASDFLAKAAPDYNFLRAVRTAQGNEMTYDQEGFPWRLFPYQENTVTVDSVQTADQAFKAAAGFGRLTRLLHGVNIDQFRETISRFHDLALRYEQLKAAIKSASQERLALSASCIAAANKFYPLVATYNDLINSGSLQRRVTHNDTKINNILFDGSTGEVVSVIDLDTLMPGYFIYDFGDMVRTFVSPVTEEEADYDKILFRQHIYTALREGYLSEMSGVMSDGERHAIPFAGKMMTYIMALRFLADYLNGDTYYHTTYEGQNLVRAGNQISFLEELEKNSGL